MNATPNTPGTQASLWNGPAGRAWVETQDLLDRIFRPFEPLLVEPDAAATPGGRVLDVGCGTGGTTLAVARRLGPTAACVGVDISDPMIAAARARAAREGVPATFLRADAESHPFDPACFDRVVSRFGVMFFGDPVRAFANLRYATDDGGTLRVIAWRGPAENPIMTTAERAAAPLLPGLPPRRPDAPGQFAFADPDRVRSILHSSGWAHPDVHPLDVECAFPESDLTRYINRLGPVGVALADAPEPTRARVITAARAAFAPYVHGPDVRFTAACWLITARAIPR
jgi:SAM-dependent methyltransferase